MQADLFQAPVVAARQRGHDMAALAADRADRAVDGWVDMAVERLRVFARNTKLPFTIELARSVIGQEVPEPTDKRAWGQVTLTAKRLGYIVALRGQFFSAVSSHGSPKQLYGRGPKA